MNRSRLIVITGVTRGCGRAMTEEFAAHGCTVVGCGRSEPELGVLRKRFPSPHDLTRLDVASDQQVSLWASRILAEKGPPDLLINNAAVINPNAPLWSVVASEFDRVIDINIKGTANVLRHFLPAMVAQRRGVIVNFSSGWGRSTDAEVAPYCATKWAIEGLTQALAQELPSGMAAVPLNPGVINTEMLQSCFGGSASAYPSPREWAKSAVPFLLSLGPRHNGQPLSVPNVPV
jgi:NAD(P)-dependent dehydrogenase (short-subunit alcohol dehydrogenase family)